MHVSLKKSEIAITYTDTNISLGFTVNTRIFNANCYKSDMLGFTHLFEDLQIYFYNLLNCKKHVNIMFILKLQVLYKAQSKNIKILISVDILLFLLHAKAVLK